MYKWIKPILRSCYIDFKYGIQIKHYGLYGLMSKSGPFFKANKETDSRQPLATKLAKHSSQTILKNRS